MALGERHVVAFSTDHTVAYLLGLWEDKCIVVRRWFLGRPELSTFNPAHWRLKQAHAGNGGTFYDAEPVRGYF